MAVPPALLGLQVRLLGMACNMRVGFGCVNFVHRQVAACASAHACSAFQVGTGVAADLAYPILLPICRLLAAVAALCSLAIVVAEATIAGVLPNLSVVSVALRSTAGGWEECCDITCCCCFSGEGQTQLLPQLRDNSGLCVAMVSPPHHSQDRPACPVPSSAPLPAGSPFATELLCFLFLAYPCACAYYSLYRCASWDCFGLHAGFVCKPAVFLGRFFFRACTLCITPATPLHHPAGWAGLHSIAWCRATQTPTRCATQVRDQQKQELGTPWLVLTGCGSVSSMPKQTVLAVLAGVVRQWALRPRNRSLSGAAPHLPPF